LIVKLPRVSIATLIAVVVLLAVDCALLRNPFGGTDAAMMTLCTLPMGNLLLFGLYVSYVRSRRGERTLFLLGFELFGWAAVFALLYACNAFTAQLDVLLLPVYVPVREVFMDNLPFELMRSVDPTFVVAHKISTAMGLLAVSMVLTALCSLVAFAGGWTFYRLGRASRRTVSSP
jgi:hypothetical protein